MSQNLELKVQALLERVSGLTQQYENQVADLRVELTLVSQERDALKAQSEQTDSDPRGMEAIEGEVVED